MSPKMPDNQNEREERTAQYRQNAETLRWLAAKIRFDFCRRTQLFALAAGFDQLADRVDEPCLREAAD